MSTDRELWLASLRADAQVAVIRSVWAEPTIHTVKSRPLGAFVLSDGNTYNRRRYDGECQLEPITPELLADIEHRELVSRVNSLVTRLSNVNMVKNLSDDALRKIADVFKKYV